MPRQGFEDICPKQIAGELKCSCKKGCMTSTCSCVKNKQKCSVACKCGIECQNNENEKSTTEDLEPCLSDTDSEYDSD